MFSSDDNSRAAEHWTERELDEAAFKDPCQRPPSYRG